jgi:hypothetical protein
MVCALIPAGDVGGKQIIAFDAPDPKFGELVEVEDPTPDDGLYMHHGRALVSGRRIKLDHIPKYLKRRGAGIIVDYTSSRGLLCVSDKFKSIVEGVEPDVHQFIPFDIVGTRKAVIARMWFMVVCNRLDSVDREHTTLILWKGAIWSPAQDFPSWEWPPEYDPSKPNRLVFNLSQIGDRHLWFDKHVS